MMARTNTTKLSSFSRGFPSAVTYALSSPPYSSKVVTITLPTGSDWTSGLHWHETHTEYLRVIKGTALVTLDGVTARFTPQSGTITVPKYARHEWRRASIDQEGELVVEEWTDPADGQKELFFRNLNGIILDETKNGPPKVWKLELELHTLFWYADNWPSIHTFGWLPTSLGKGLEWLLTHTLILVAVLLGVILGARGVYREYTPERPEVSKKVSKEL